MGAVTTGALQSILGDTSKVGADVGDAVVTRLLEKPEIQQLVRHSDETVVQATTLLKILGFVAVGAGAAYMVARLRRPGGRRKR